MELSAITVNAGAATVFALTGAGTATAGGSYSLTVTAKDAYGDTVTNYTGTVSFTSNDPSAVLPSSYTFVAEDGGVKTFSVIFATAGSRTVTASDGTRSGTSPAITVGAGAPSLANSVVTASANSVASGTSITLILTVKDSYGNITSGGLTNITLPIVTGKQIGRASCRERVCLYV